MVWSSSTTAVCPVKIVLASMILFSLGVALMSQRQMVWSSEAESRWPFRLGFQERPYPSFWWPLSFRSGWHLPLGSGLLGCLVKSNTNTSELGVLVAMTQGFC